MIKTFRFDDPNEFSSNTYVIGEEGKSCVVVDVGSTNDRIIEYIKVHHCNSCVGVLLTHGHFDHIRGLKKFLGEYHCTLFIDEKEVDLLDNTRLNGSVTFDELISIEYDNKYLFDDLDEINFGNDYIFKVIETPGHTKGSVCFLLEKEKALFTGDTLFKNSVGRSDLPTGSEKSLILSLNKIKEFNEDYKIFPGHGEITTLLKEKKFNVYLK